MQPNSFIEEDDRRINASTKRFRKRSKKAKKRNSIDQKNNYFEEISLKPDNENINFFSEKKTLGIGNNFLKSFEKNNEKEIPIKKKRKSISTKKKQKDIKKYYDQTLKENLDEEKCDPLVEWKNKIEAKKMEKRILKIKIMQEWDKNNKILENKKKELKSKESQNNSSNFNLNIGSSLKKKNVVKEALKPSLFETKRKSQMNKALGILKNMCDQ